MLKNTAVFTMLITLAVITAYGILYTPPVREATTRQAEYITVNNKVIDEPPITNEHIIYLPIRPVAEEIGYEIKWSEKAITLKNGNHTITLNHKKAAIQKEEYKLKKYVSYKNPIIIKNQIAYLSKQDMQDIFELQINKERNAINIMYNKEISHHITLNDGIGKSTLMLSYSDSYFDNTAFEYSPQLAELCIALSSGAYAISAINQAYKNMGYTASFYNYTKINKETSAYSIAEKTLTDKKIYIICIRGTSGDEWYTNFDIYKDKNTPSANHYGFFMAEQELRSTLKTHLENDPYEGRRIFLITGHSRGGAVANILGAHLSSDKKYAQPQDIYTYTYAAPNVSVNADIKTKNIYNFCNASDIVTHLPINGKLYTPDEQEWLYNKNGTTITFDNTDIKQTSLTGYMEEEFKSITGREFIPINKATLHTAIMSLKMLIPKVADYYTKSLGVGNVHMSAYEFFIGGLATAQAFGTNVEESMLLIADGMFKGDMSDISRFIVFNSIEGSRKNTDGSITEKGRGLNYNHSCEAYYAWVKAYNREYFRR